MLKPLYEIVSASVQFSYQICLVLGRLIIEVLRLNYQLVAAIIRLVRDSMDVAVSLTLMLSSAIVDVMFHIGEFLSHVWSATVSYADLIYKFLSPFFRHFLIFLVELLNTFWYIIRLILEYFIAVCLSVFSSIYALIENFTSYFAFGRTSHRISTEYSQKLSDETEESPSSIGIEYYIANIDAWLRESIESVVVYVQECWYQLSSKGTAAFMHCFQSFANEPHYTYTVGLMVVCSLMLMMSNMLLKLMKSKGLTVPFIHAQRNQQELELLIQDAMDADSSDTAEDDSENSEDQMSDQEIIIDDDSVEDFNTDAENTPVDSSDNDSDMSDNEGIHFVNVQLPEKRVTRQAARRSLTPLPSTSGALSPKHLQQILENEKDKQRCVVCQDNPKTVLVLPCKHMCLCVACAHAIANDRRRERQTCPLCRTPMETVMNVYT